jgi:hypothetical protein
MPLPPAAASAKWFASIRAALTAGFSDEDVRAAATWLAQWREEVALDAVVYSPYEKAPATEKALGAYLTALRAAQVEAEYQAAVAAQYEAAAAQVEAEYQAAVAAQDEAA